MSWKKYSKTFTMGLQNALEYRTNFLLGLLSAVFPILIQIFLWKAIFHSQEDSSVFGYSEAQVIAYAVLAPLFAKLVSTGFEYDIANDVKNGQLSKFVVQPIRYFVFRLCSFLGEKSLHMSIVAIITAIAAVFVRNAIPWDISRILVCVLSLLLAVAVNFLISYNLSMISFWMLEVWGVFLTFGLVANIASGGIFPLDMFGETAQAILNVLPFKYIVFFPVSVLLGKLSSSEMLFGLLIQVVWIVVLTGVSSLLWTKGMKKYESVGG